VVEHVAQRDERQPRFPGDPGETGDAPGVVAAIKMMRCEIGAAGEIRRDLFCKRKMGSQRRGIARLGRQRDDALQLADQGVKPRGGLVF